MHLQDILKVFAHVCLRKELIDLIDIGVTWVFLHNCAINLKFGPVVAQKMRIDSQI